MSDDQRQRQLEAIITTAALVANDDASTAVALIIGALTLACCRSKAPAAALQVAIDSLTHAQNILVARGPAAQGGN